jgi:glycine hydroxymethyltransferase
MALTTPSSLRIVSHAPSSAAPSTGVDRVLRAVAQHADYRAGCVGLVPTENLLSPLARSVMGSDLSHRYLFQNPQWRYVGGKHLSEVEAAAQEIASELFGAAFVNVRPLSGENCTNIVIHAVVERGATFYHLGMHDGGHFAANSVAERMTDRRRLLPYDADNASIDLDGCARAFAAEPPDVIYLDASMVLFPHPLSRLRELAGPDAIIVYDASQVLGLIAGGAFQDPLREGADILSGSTHKSLPGPQKGIVMTNRADLMARVEATIFPGHVSNFHLHHVAALAVTLAETQAFGADYARQTLANAHAFGTELRRLGLLVQGGARVTASHQVWLDVTDHATPDEAVDRLHAAHLIANVNLIPTLRAKGLRLGTPEATRLGMREAEMRTLAGLVHATLAGTLPLDAIGERVSALAERFRTVRYCYPEPAAA